MDKFGYISTLLPKHMHPCQPKQLPRQVEAEYSGCEGRAEVSLAPDGVQEGADAQLPLE